MVDALLTPEQIDAIAKQPERPAHFRDPSTLLDYVVVRSDVYAQLLGLANDDHISDGYAAADHAFAEGWNHPLMDDYDRYDELKR